MKIDLPEIEDNATLFAGVRTQELIIGPNVRKIGTKGFINVQAQTLTIKEGVQTIGNNAFAGITSLQGKLKIPNSVISIGNQAFGRMHTDLIVNLF